MKIAKCSNCRQPVPDEHDTSDAECSPCPQCGCLARVIEILLEDHATAYDSLALKARHGPTGRPFVESKARYEFSFERRQMILRNLHINRDTDIYRESVVDPDTGEVIHEVYEPLSAHQGHGAARRGPKDV